MADPQDETLEEAWAELARQDAAAKAAPTESAPEEAAESAAGPQADEPADEPKADDPQADEPAAETAADKGTDHWAGATPEQIAELARLRQIENTFKGRQRASQNEINRLRQQLAELTRKPDPAKDEASKAALDNAEEQFPETVRPLRNEILSLKEELAALRESQRALAESRIAESEMSGYDALVAAHPDAMEIAGRKEFVEWVRTKPRYVREAVQRNAERIVDAEEAIDIISAYKAETGTMPRLTGADRSPNRLAQPSAPASQDPVRRQQLTGLSAPRGRASLAPKGEPEPTDSLEAEWEYWRRKGHGSHLTRRSM